MNSFSSFGRPLAFARFPPNRLTIWPGTRNMTRPIGGDQFGSMYSWDNQSFNKFHFKVNYLALDALYSYANHGGPFARLSAELYDQLRENILRNVADQYAKTGFLWERELFFVKIEKKI